MSLKAMAWAIDQQCGSPSAKVTLWSIANHANPATWVTWAGQSHFVEETEQSPDSVQRRIPELVERGLLRRLPLKYDGRRTTDLYILKPSPYWTAAIAELEALLPRGFVVDPKFAAAYVAADCGNDLSSETDDGQKPQTLPQPAENAAATVRQQEPEKEPINQEREGAREERPTARDAVDAALKAWPTPALQNPELALAAMERRPPSDRQLLVDRIPDFLDFHKTQAPSAKLPFLHNYIAQENRWRDLPERPKVPAKGEDPSRVAAFSRTWWWLFWRAAMNGASAALRIKVSGAVEKGFAWPVDPTKRAAFDEAAERDLTNAHRDSDRAKGWRDYYRSIGIDMPIPDVAEYLFLPRDGPPTDRGLSKADREFASEGAE